MTLVLVGVGCFTLGVLCGVFLRDAYELLAHGRGFIMTTGRGVVERIGWGRLLSLLLLVALVMNAVLGFALIGARQSADRANENLDRLVVCLEAYNRDDGEARDERDAISRRITASELILWGKIRDVFRGDPDGDAGETVLAAIERYLDDVRALQTARLEHPYPDPAQCRPGADATDEAR